MNPAIIILTTGCTFKNIPKAIGWSLGLYSTAASAAAVVVAVAALQPVPARTSGIAISKTNNIVRNLFILFSFNDCDDFVKFDIYSPPSFLSIHPLILYKSLIIF